MEGHHWTNGVERVVVHSQWDNNNNQIEMMPHPLVSGKYIEEGANEICESSGEKNRPHWLMCQGMELRGAQTWHHNNPDNRLLHTHLRRRCIREIVQSQPSKDLMYRPTGCLGPWRRALDKEALSRSTRQGSNLKPKPYWSESAKAVTLSHQSMKSIVLLKEKGQKIKIILSNSCHNAVPKKSLKGLPAGPELPMARIIVVLNKILNYLRTEDGYGWVK